MIAATRLPVRREMSRTAVPSTALLAVSGRQLLPGTPPVCGIHVVGALVDIDEFGGRPGLGDGFGGGDERVRDGNDRVARANACGHEREPQSIRAAAYAHAVPVSQNWAKAVSKSSTIGPPMKPAVRNAF